MGDVLRRAAEAVAEREAMYGPPAKHWAKTAVLATVLLDDVLKPGCYINADTWGRLMILDKLVRSLGPDPGIDQLVDIAGYADGIGRLEEGASRGDHAAEAAEAERAVGRPLRSVPAPCQ